MIDTDVDAPISLASLTSLKVGGPAGRLVRASTACEVRDAVARAGDRGAASLFVLGGGTNVIVSDEGVPGTVLLVEGGQLRRTEATARGTHWIVDAGVSWDRFVDATVASRCSGVEMMSGIPGRVGAAPIQNIAAYGQQICDVIESVGAIDRATLEHVELPAGDCQFGFRTSRFKSEWRDRYVVTHVSFRLPTVDMCPPDRSHYVDVERYFRSTGHSPTDVAARRQAVLSIRATKSMLIDPQDPRAQSIGSFFVNPAVPVALAEEMAGRFKTIGLRVQYLEGNRRAGADGTQRIPAAHLLRFAGFNAGDRWGPVGLSDRHILALVTHDGATATDVWRLGHFLVERVLQATGVLLDFEGFFIGAFPEFDREQFLRTYAYRPASGEEPDWLARYR